MKKTEDEIKRMREGGRILAYILNYLSQKADVGVSTEYLEEEAEKLLEKYQAKPAFKGYKIEGYPPYPTILCTSINDEVVHAPSLPGRYLKDGDILSIDMGLVYEGMYVDSAVTVGVGTVSPEHQKLIDVTRQSLEEAVKIIKSGIHTGDIGYTIEQYVSRYGFSVVKELVGHGVGRSVHEPPQIPNFGSKNTGVRLESGDTIAVEPMVNIGDWKVKFQEGVWTVKTYDGKYSAHFEHTILVLDDSCEVLTQNS